MDDGREVFLLRRELEELNQEDALLKKRAVADDLRRQVAKNRKSIAALRGKGTVVIYQLGKPVISSATHPPPIFYFAVDSAPPPPQQQTVCYADPSNGPSPLLSRQIITLEIPNGFQNVIKHKTSSPKGNDRSPESNVPRLIWPPYATFPPPQ